LSENETRLRIDDILLDASRRYVEKAGQIVPLTPREFELLHYLMRYAGEPINHSRLLISIWGPECEGRTPYLTTFIGQLRKKLEDDPADPKYLLTDKHSGYRFADTASFLKAAPE
jgi:two-component system, OmpR family, KDP operon response regulator KdpE